MRKSDYLLVMIDFDVKRLDKALGLIKNLSVLVLEEQVPALEILLGERSAKICSIEADEVLNDVLQLLPLENKHTEQYRTMAESASKKGDGIIV